MWKCLEVITLQPREGKRTPFPHSFVGEKLARVQPWNQGTERRLFWEGERNWWGATHRWLSRQGPSSIVTILITITTQWPLALSEKHFISKIAFNFYNNMTKIKSVTQGHPGSGRVWTQNQAQAKFLSRLLTHRTKLLLRGFERNLMWFVVP